METKLPMLPRQFPYKGDKAMAALLKALETGALSWEEAAAFFYMPGMGFHKSGFLLAAHTVSYRQTGHHTIAVPAHMQAALAATSLGGIKFEDLSLPHAAMYFTFPDSVFQLWGGPQTRWHKCGGVYVSYHSGDRTPDYYDGCVPALGPKEKANHCLKFYFWGVENELSSGPGDDASFWFSINLNEMEDNDWDFATYIECVLSDPNRDSTHDYFTENAIRSGLATDMSSPETIKDVHKLTRLVLNSLLYLTSADAVVEPDPVGLVQQTELKNLRAALGRMKNKSKGKARRLQRKITEIPPDKILWIGGADPSATQTKAGQPITFIKQGSWWPRRDLLQHRLEDLETQITTLEGLMEGSKESLANAEGVEDVAQAVREIALQQRWMGMKVRKIEALQESLDATRRWVPPHRNKGG